MSAYKCFFIGGNGRIANVLFADHTSDEAALAWAFGVCRHNPEYDHVEIWEGDRVVHNGPPRER